MAAEIGAPLRIAIALRVRILILAPCIQNQNTASIPGALKLRKAERENGAWITVEVKGVSQKVVQRPPMVAEIIVVFTAIALIDASSKDATNPAGPQAKCASFITAIINVSTRDVVKLQRPQVSTAPFMEVANAVRRTVVSALP